MKRLKIVLTNDDHVGPLHNVSVNLPNVDVCDDDEAAILMPFSEHTDVEVQKAAVRLKCLDCDCVLLQGEDFEFEEVEESEPWR